MRVGPAEEMREDKGAIGMKLRRAIDLGKISRLVFAILIAALVVTLINIPNASSELVYDDQVPLSSPAVPQPHTQAPPRQQVVAPQVQVQQTVPNNRVDQRSNLRKVVGSAQRAEQAVAQNPPQPQYVQPPVQYVQPQYVQPQPQYVLPAPQGVQVSAEDGGVENLSKAELIRRERMRQELNNEDILQSRLEELRLQGERGRTDQILGNTGVETGPTQVQGGPVQNEYIGGVGTGEQYSTSRPGQIVQSDDTISMSQSQAEKVYEDYPSNPGSKEEFFSFGIRGGVSDMSSNGYDINPRYSMGFEIGFETSERLVVQMGYQFNEYGLEMPTSNPFLANFYNQFGNFQNQETLRFRQNVFDANLKMYLLNKRDKFRPFVGVGAGYAVGFINYDDRIRNYWRSVGVNSFSDDYEISQYLAILSTGFDVAVSKSVHVGAQFKYHHVLSSNESGNINNYAFFPGGNQNQFYEQWDKQNAAGSLTDTNFYSVLLGASFVF